jgi:hypothetical protein
MLRPYPQYSNPPSPTWDNVANVSYNSIQISLAQWTWKGLSYTLNYTYSKNLDDDSTNVRSAFAVPAAASSSGTAISGNNRSSRGLTATDTPQNLNIYGVDELPFGKGKWGSDNFFVRNIIGGWALSGIFTYRSGVPLQIIGSGCTTPTSGTCFLTSTPTFPDLSVRTEAGAKALQLLISTLFRISILQPFSCRIHFRCRQTPPTPQWQPPKLATRREVPRLTPGLPVLIT